MKTEDNGMQLNKTKTMAETIDESLTTLDGFGETSILEQTTKNAVESLRQDLAEYNAGQMVGTKGMRQAREKASVSTAMGSNNESLMVIDQMHKNQMLLINNMMGQPGIDIQTEGTDMRTDTQANMTGGEVEEIDGVKLSAEGIKLTTKWEVGGSKKGYSTYGDIGDDAGITAGKYQFTEKSGSLQKVAKKLGYDNIRDEGFKKALGSEEGKRAQDAVYLEQYAKPAIKKAKQLGIEDPNVVAFLVDTNINGGLQSVLKNAKGDYSLKNLIEVRQKRYDRLAAKKPKLAKFKKGWRNRMDDWRKLV